MNPAYIHLSKDSIDDSKKQLHLLEKKNIFKVARLINEFYKKKK